MNLSEKQVVNNIFIFLFKLNYNEKLSFLTTAERQRRFSMKISTDCFREYIRNINNLNFLRVIKITDIN